MDDREIIELFNARSEDAVRAVSDKYGGLCAAVSRNILQNNQAVEECVNDTFLKAWESIPPAKPKNLAAYLARIAKNISINRWKNDRREKRGGGVEQVFEELEGFAAGGSSVEDDTERRAVIAEINLFLNGLPTSKRTMFVRRYWFCDGISELAALYGMSENNVSAILSRTRAELKKYLKKRGYYND